MNDTISSFKNQYKKTITCKFDNLGIFIPSLFPSLWKDPEKITKLSKNSSRVAVEDEQVEGRQAIFIYQ